MGIYGTAASQETRKGSCSRADAKETNSGKHWHLSGFSTALACRLHCHEVKGSRCFCIDCWRLVLGRHRCSAGSQATNEAGERLHVMHCSHQPGETPTPCMDGKDAYEALQPAA